MKYLLLIIGLALIFITFGFFLNSNEKPSVTNQKDNVTIADGKQIIEIRAKGGYQPRKSVARAGVPTIIRFTTKGTFDCSSSIRIPSLNIDKILPASGSIDIPIEAQQPGVLQGSCGMGMYQFSITFE